MTVADCPRGRIALAAGSDPAHVLGIDTARSAGGGFRNVHGIAMSPVGEFPDWSAAAPWQRSVFEAVSRCVARDPSLGSVAAMGGGAIERANGERPRPTFPWRLGVALMLVAIGWFAVRSRRNERIRRRELWSIVVIACATWTFQRTSVEPAFFHQNGQGALWISFALGEPSRYGPGYAEVFGLVARGFLRTPEAAIFEAQALLFALVPACAWLLGRRARLEPAMCAALALGLAIQPTAARVARSESYYALIASLVTIAAALVATGARPMRVRSVAFATCVPAAGLLVAQAALVHPVAWVASALIPLVALSPRARVRRRLNVALATAGVIALVVVATSGREMIDVMRGQLVRSWMPHASSGMTASRVWPVLVAFVPPALIWLLLARRRGDAALRCAALALAIIVAATTTLTFALAPWITEIYRALYLPAVLANVAGILSALPFSARGMRLVAAAVLLAASAFAAARWHRLTVLPTDAREAQLTLTWRAALPDDSAVFALDHAGNHVFIFPLYDLPGAGGTRAIRRSLAPDRDPPDPRGAAARVYYYRSSLCTTDVGASFCDRLEQTYRLELAESALLPALSGTDGLGYSARTVRIGLYRIVDVMR